MFWHVEEINRREIQLNATKKDLQNNGKNILTFLFKQDILCLALPKAGGTLFIQSFNYHTSNFSKQDVSQLV